MAVLGDGGVTAGRIYSAMDVLEDAHMLERGSIITVLDEDLGDVWMQAPMPRLKHSPGSVKWTGGSPGQHTDEVFSELLGLERSDFERLRASSVI